MKIGDIEIGQEYVFRADWGRYSRKRVKALEIVTPPVRSRYERKVRKVRCQVLDWDTGEPIAEASPGLGGGKAEIVEAARSLEPYTEVMERIRAQEARKADHEDRRQRVEKALNMLGVPCSVHVSHGGVVVVSLDGNGIDALEHHALTD